MTKTRNTKTSLISSVISLLLCFSMLLGTTFAWFTDSVTSEGNTIQSGSLKIDLLHKVENEWISIKQNPEHKIFNYDKWEPGYTRVETLKAENLGTLALQYKLSLTVEDGTAILGKNGENLADVIEVYVSYGENTATSYEAILANPAWSYKGTLAEAMKNPSSFLGGQLIPAGETLDAGAAATTAVGSQAVSIALHMDKNAGNEYQKLSVGNVYVNLIATQWSSENDSFGSDYDKDSEWPNNVTVGNSASAFITATNNRTDALAELLSANGKISATVPAGALVNAGTSKLTLTVSDVEKSEANITLNENENALSVDVHIDGIAEDNEVVMAIFIKELLPVGLNMGNYRFYHVEDGATVEMTLLADGATAVHNNYEYDPATGDVVLYLASFSEVALVAEPAKWEGKYDYSWYDASKTELLIANSDQLAGFGAIVGGMNGKTADDFAGKTVKLLADIKIDDLTDEDGRAVMFYPIGYYNTTGSYEKKSGVEVTSGFKNFAGTFDGNGHTVSDWYQNTWEAFGDYNDGYSGTPNHYRDGFGLFGRVYKGTVKNLTVNNFSSDGEFTTTGTIAAYAEGATFENIAIFNCNPRVYNIGNGGIVGCVGWYAKEAGLKTTFKNITVDNTNKITALWGSWDVACGGIVGQYYPTSGQESAGKPANGGVHFENCHVAAQIDVYNDVCANYQYYAYRYSGILMGSVRENVVIDGHEYPKMDGITASGCTVHFGDWNDYYYCELVANSLASYTHDHQMSRLEQVAAVDVANKKVTYLDGKVADITGTKNFVVVKAKGDDGKWIHGDGDDYATCYHFVNGEVWNHESAGTEIVDGVEVLKEDKQLVYREFENLVTGYGWGVTSKGVGELAGVKILDREEGTSVEKFTDKGVAEIESGTAIKLSDLFNFVSSVVLKLEGLNVTVTDLNDADGIATGTFNKAATWEESTITINGKGAIAITIQDYYFCEPTTIELTVKDPFTMTVTDNNEGNYAIGDTLNLTVSVDFKHGEDKILAVGEYTINDVDMSTSGAKLVTVTYNDGVQTQEISIWIKIVVPTGIYVETVKDRFELGATVSKNNFKVYTTSNDGTVATINDFQVSGLNPNVAGTQTATITYGEFTTTSNITFIKIPDATQVLDPSGINPNSLFNAVGFWTGSSSWLAYPHGEAATNYSYTGTLGETYTDFYTGKAMADGVVPNLTSGYQGLTVNNAQKGTWVGVVTNIGFNKKIVEAGYYFDSDWLTYENCTVNGGSVTQHWENDANAAAAQIYWVQLVAKTNLSAFELNDPNEHTVNWIVKFEDGTMVTFAQHKFKMAQVSGELYEETDKPNVNVIILAGQSNATGHAPLTQSIKDKVAGTDFSNIYMHYKTSDGTDFTHAKQSNVGFDQYVPGMGAWVNPNAVDAEYFGPELGLAQYIVSSKAMNGERWYIIKYSVCGSGLASDWLANKNYAQDMLNFVDEAVSELSKTYDVKISGLLWMQGETDAMGEYAASQYATNEQSFVTMVRNKFAKYATRVGSEAGSGITFIDMQIAPDNDIRYWTYAETVNTAKYNNCTNYVSGYYGMAGSLVPGAGWGVNANGKIPNSIYVETVDYTYKVETPNEHGEYAVLGDTADDCHYSAGSMFGMGIDKFGIALEYMLNSGTVATPSTPDAPKFTVTYDTADGNATTSVTATQGEKIALLTPTREGYTFKGWSDGSNTYAAGAEYTVNGDVMLTAQWERIQYTVTYNANGGSVSSSSETVNPGDSVTLPTPTRDGYTFKGWSDGTNTYAAGAKYTVTGDVTLTAQWERIQYIVTYNANGGSVSPSSATVNAGESVTLPTPNREGYTFNGWYTATSGGTKIGDAGASYTPSANITLYAQWTIASYKVTIDTSNASVIGVTNGQMIEYGQTVSVTVSFDKSNSRTFTVTSGNETLLTASKDGTYTFTMPAGDVTIKASSSGCFVAGTLITLADGSVKPVEEITYDDALLAWDFNTGSYAVTVPSLIEIHETETCRVINLNFADGTIVRIVAEHGFFDVESNKFVFIDEKNVADYVGHNFVKVSADGGYETVELIAYNVTVETVSYYTIQTAIYNNCIAENMFTLTSPPEMLDNDEWFDYFEIGDDMKYDEEKMQADIEKYGLYTYEDFADYVTYEQFIAFNGPYLKVLVGRGVLTYDEILELIATYVNP